MHNVPFSKVGSWKISDEEVVKKILAGEKAFYELLMRRYNQKLYRVVTGYLRNRDDVADVMQDTYLKAYEKLHQFKFKSSFSTWLIRIAINEALGKLRRDEKYVKMIGGSEDLVSGIRGMPPSLQEDPERLIIQKEARQMVEKAISELAPGYRAVYIMREVEGMPLAEIAECLELSTANVKVRLHRARKMIKEELFVLSSATNTFEFGFGSCDALVERVMSLL